MGKDKHKHSSAEKKKSKHSKKSKKDKKRDRKSPSSSESSGGPPDFVADAKNAAVAADYIRAILRKWPGMKGELRELLWQIDQQQGVNIGALPDAKLKGAMRGLFLNLNLRHTKQGTYALRPGQDKVLRRVGVVFQEAIPDESDRPLRLPGDPTLDAAAPDAAPAARPPSPPASRPSAPAAQPVIIEAPPGRPDGGAAARQLGGEEAEAPQRSVGPAAPSEAVRRAAADAAAAMRQQGLLDNILEGAPSELVGPAPPEAVAEADASAAGTRSAEVERVLAVLDKQARAGGGVEPDAYDVLGAEPTATASEVRKRFWRVSLLVHPDKCEHARAGDAFDAVKKAAHALQDANARRGIDASRAAAEDAELDRQVAAELEQERRWRVLQGKATAADLKGADTPAQPLVRESWMTDAPDVVAGAPAYMKQKSVTSFSQGPSKAAIDPTWMAKPGETGPQLLTGGTVGTVQPVSAHDAISQQNAELMRVVAQENAAQASTEQDAPKSLLDQHRDAQERSKQRKRTRTTEHASGPPPPAAQPADAKGKAWVPFDREQEMQGPSSGKSRYAALLDGDSSLSTRFHKDK